MNVVVETIFEFPTTLLKAIQKQAHGWQNQPPAPRLARNCENAITHLNAAFATICAEDMNFHKTLREEFLSKGIDTDAASIANYDVEIDGVMTAWLDTASCLENIATQLEHHHFAIQGVAELQTNIEEFTAALNPSYELSGAMAELAVQAQDALKQGEIEEV